MDRTTEFVQQLTDAQRRLYAFILSLMVHPDDAEDVLQEVNLVLWQKSGEFQPGTSFDAWAYKVAHLQVLAYRKRVQRQRVLLDDALLARIADVARDEMASVEDRRRALWQCLQKLPSQQREMIRLRYSPGGSVQAIADALKRSVGAISQSLYRIRGQLLECIERQQASEGKLS